MAKPDNRAAEHKGNGIQHNESKEMGGARRCNTSHERPDNKRKSNGRNRNSRRKGTPTRQAASKQQRCCHKLNCRKQGIDDGLDIHQMVLPMYWAIRLRQSRLHRRLKKSVSPPDSVRLLPATRTTCIMLTS